MSLNTDSLLPSTFLHENMPCPQSSITAANRRGLRLETSVYHIRNVSPSRSSSSASENHRHNTLNLC